MSTLTTTADEPRGHRGPRRLGIAGFLLFASGSAAAAAASLQTMQNDGVVASLVGDTLSMLFGMSSSGDSDSMLLMVALILGFIAAAVGLSCMIMAALWSIARLRIRHHAARSWDKMEPAVTGLGHRGRDALSSAADHSAPVLNEGTRRARSLLSRRRGTAPAPAPVAAAIAPPSPLPPTLSGLTAGDPLDTSLETGPSV